MKNLLLQIFTWWNGQTMGTRFATWRFGKRVGEDELGNVYYEGGTSSFGLPRRWVIYKGYAEASAIPPGWHGWMHHRTDVPPSKENYVAKDWQRSPRQPDRLGSGLSSARFAGRCRRAPARDRRLRRLDARQLIGPSGPVLATIDLYPQVGRRHCGH
jgi:NADH:ubiquinone oxidoreductase subunit